jgi:amidophosphoribosyltransferase
MGSHVGVFGRENAGVLSYLMLYSMMSMGKAGSGISVAQPQHRVIKDDDNPREVFKGKIETIPGTSAIGGTVYSLEHIPGGIMPYATLLGPATGITKGNNISITLEGRITNADKLHERLDYEGSSFSRYFQEELLMHLIARSNKKTLEERMVDALSKIEGHFSVVAMADNTGFAAIDSQATSPLYLFSFKGGNIVTTDKEGTQIISDYLPKKIDVQKLEPGLLYRMHDGEVQTFKFADKQRQETCLHRIDYFALATNEAIASFRELAGADAFENAADFSQYMAAIPNSGNHYFNGALQRSILQGTGHMPIIAITRMPYGGGRLLDIETGTGEELAYWAKFSFAKQEKKLDSITYYDDGTRQGNTLRWIAKQTRKYIANKVGVAVGSAPIVRDCTRIRDFGTVKNYIADGRTNTEIAKALGLDFFYAPTLERTIELAKEAGITPSFCTDCYKK